MEDSEDTQSSSPSRPSQMSPPPPSPPEQYSEDETGYPPVTVASLAPESEDEQARRQPVTVQKPKSSGTGGGTAGGGGREDCWSEGATSVLIDAWGERFLELTRGNLKQKHWQEVADVVSGRDDYTKTAKTDVQCKNRIDTLKKKYKLEKSKITAARSSNWPFFRRLDDLIGRNPHNKPEPVVNKTNKKKPPKRTKFELQLELKSCKKKKRSTKTHNQLSKKTTTKPVVESTAGKVPPANRTVNGKRKRLSECRPPVPTGGGGERGKGLSEVVKAVVKIGEVYERVERAKLEQAAEMEKQRMVFSKELELQRMQFLLKTQLELTQIKHNNGVKKNMDDDRDHHHHHRDSNEENNNNNGDSSNNNSNKV